MRIFVFLLCFLTFAAVAEEQLPNSDRLLQLYNDVKSGRRSLQSLSPTEQQKILMMYRLLSRSCGHLEGKCHTVCEAADKLEKAAQDLAHCAHKQDYSNDCHRYARNVRSAADEYESAVSDASGDCD